eukprot:6179214-Pleurochrysis_carterae.AAC.6
MAICPVNCLCFTPNRRLTHYHAPIPKLSVDAERANRQTRIWMSAKQREEKCSTSAAVHSSGEREDDHR